MIKLFFSRAICADKHEQVGTYVFPIIEADGKTATQQGQYPFWVASSLALVSAALAMFCLPHIGQDTIDEEDRRFRKALAESGYDLKQIGDGRHASVVVVDAERASGSSGEGFEKGHNAPKAS